MIQIQLRSYTLSHPGSLALELITVSLDQRQISTNLCMLSEAVWQ
jgi:hypothetical protein